MVVRKLTECVRYAGKHSCGDRTCGIWSLAIIIIAAWPTALIQQACQVRNQMGRSQNLILDGCSWWVGDIIIVAHA